MSTNLIGLDKVGAESLADQLNQLLANYQVLYMNVRGFHWNVQGANFFELHAKFEEIYDQLLLKVDEIAERILTLGHQPRHAFSDYLKMSQIDEVKGVRDGHVAIESILSAYKLLLSQQRRILAQASELGDEGTVSLMSDYISQQEKESWMLAAYQGRGA
ncbi:Dps family protein [Ferrimonas balearica]|uniref:Dps family protein n=1 Tax=Ferrimonas balearica TaxID=44012 RepID=UPI001C990B39|nr:Dps family protein [Ferrimonas balearica]MBY5923313.1 DNA starvation/stationary phase protection protein [Ferrimonas balearica]MBY5995271.1 DNA starvation/stationary phase protection protein [Ferrimonas balearica]